MAKKATTARIAPHHEARHFGAAESEHGEQGGDPEGGGKAGEDASHHGGTLLRSLLRARLLLLLLRTGLIRTLLHPRRRGSGLLREGRRGTPETAATAETAGGIGIHGGGHQTETKNKSGQKVFHGSVHVSVTVKKESAEADREC